MPKISVIVPVYKVDLYIHRCIDSVLSQTFEDFELILIDDGSTDNCPVICDEYAAKDSRIHTIHQQNGGLSAARNAGIDWAFANSDSEWITFIDSDDWVHSQYLELLYSAAINNNCDISICNYISTNNCSAIIDPNGLIEISTPEDFLIDRPINATIACGKLYKKNCFNLIRYPVGRIHEDEFVTYKILFSKKQIAILSASLYYYWENPNGITKSEWTPKRLDAIIALKEQISFFKKHSYNRALKHVIVVFSNTLCKNISLAFKSSLDIKTKYTINKNLSRELKKLLIKHHNLFPFRSNKYMYECAFPKIMNLYWLYVGMFKHQK